MLTTTALLPLAAAALLAPIAAADGQAAPPPAPAIGTPPAPVDPAPRPPADYRLVSAPPAATPQHIAPPTLSGSNHTPPGVVPVGIPYLPPLTETMVLTSPVPTVSPTWGMRVALINGQVLAAGPELALQGGNHGQLANWRQVDGTWKPNLRTAEVMDMARLDLIFKDCASAPGSFMTVLNRRAGGTLVAVFHPEGEGWAQWATLNLPSGVVRPGFGGAIATDGSFAAVSSVDLRVTSDKPPLSTNPEVYIYSRTPSMWQLNGYVQVPQANPAKPREAMWFGTSLAMDVGTMAVGAPQTIVPRPNETTPISGDAAVFVYRKSGENWLVESELKGLDTTMWPCFGVNVALEGDLLAVRALDPSVPTTPGKVWLFTRRNGTWTRTQELQPVESCLAGRGYGTAMRISKGRIVITDPTAKGLDEQMGYTPGMAFVFEKGADGTYTNTKRLMPKAPCAPVGFGLDVAMDWPWIAIGRVKNETLQLEPGGVYLWKME
jgi:hypothetical protein